MSFEASFGWLLMADAAGSAGMWHVALHAGSGNLANEHSLDLLIPEY
jgi:hypothetical protein